LKVLILDNYDSFTFNLFHYVEGLGVEVVVKRNDEISSNEVAQFDKIILSPGPGLPDESIGMMEIIKEWHDKRPILGVCLGMQALAVFFGDQLRNQEKVFHGVQKEVKKINNTKILDGISTIFPVALYHSWSVECLENSPFIPTSISEDGVLMSFEHKELPLYGVQFHPESILTPNGKEILSNFLFK
jgi:anthranilate synthase component 2